MADQNASEERWNVGTYYEPQYQSESQSRPIERQDQNFEGENRFSHVFVDDFPVDQDWLASSHIWMSEEDKYKLGMINCKLTLDTNFSRCHSAKPVQDNLLCRALN